MSTDAATLEQIVEACLARAEVRLTHMVNERTTNVISATTALVVGIQEEVVTTGEALTSLSETVTVTLAALNGQVVSLERRVASLEENIAERRHLINVELASLRDAIDALQDAAPAGAPDPARPPLRALVATYRAETRAALTAAQAEMRRWGVALALFIVILELGQWLFLIWRPT